MSSTIYIAKADYLSELCDELGEVTDVKENCVFSPVQKPDVCFALDVWPSPNVVTFQSISEATRTLKQSGKFWFLNPISHIRRSHLIQENLRKLPDLTIEFLLQKEIPHIGCFSLLDQNTLLYANTRWKKIPLGHYQFIEDKHNPPNRAYLKLWESLSLLEKYPKPGDSVIDLGASPGGWTYVMQSLGAHVTAVDKAPLAPNIAKLPHIQFLQQSAFALDPRSLDQPVDWLLCDVACYPERLYGLINQWIDAKKAKQMIFTIKLQGETSLEAIRPFQAIPNARVLHLFHNKHEATFIYPAPAHLFSEF